MGALMPGIGDPTPSLGRWDTLFDGNNLAHVVPLFGPPHFLSEDCWCHPVMDGERYAEPAMSHNVAQ